MNVFEIDCPERKGTSFAVSYCVEQRDTGRKECKQCPALERALAAIAARNGRAPRPNPEILGTSWSGRAWEPPRETV